MVHVVVVIALSVGVDVVVVEDVDIVHYGL